MEAVSGSRGAASHARDSVYYAVGLISELGDLTRFEHPRQLCHGLVSRHQNIHRVEADIREHYQSRKQLCQKAIGRGSVEYRHPARISPAIQKRQENLPRPSLTEHGMLNSGFVRGIENSGQRKECQYYNCCCCT